MKKFFSFFSLFLLVLPVASAIDQTVFCEDFNIENVTKCNEYFSLFNSNNTIVVNNTYYVDNSSYVNRTIVENHTSEFSIEDYEDFIEDKIEDRIEELEFSSITPEERIAIKELELEEKRIELNSSKDVDYVDQILKIQGAKAVQEVMNKELCSVYPDLSQCKQNKSIGYVTTDDLEMLKADFNSFKSKPTSPTDSNRTPALSWIFSIVMIAVLGIMGYQLYEQKKKTDEINDWMIAEEQAKANKLMIGSEFNKDE